MEKTYILLWICILLCDQNNISTFRYKTAGSTYLTSINSLGLGEISEQFDLTFPGPTYHISFPWISIVRHKWVSYLVTQGIVTTRGIVVLINNPWRQWIKAHLWMPLCSAMLKDVTNQALKIRTSDRLQISSVQLILFIIVTSMIHIMIYTIRHIIHTISSPLGLFVTNKSMTYTQWDSTGSEIHLQVMYMW